jgi:hypothetical protein
MKKKRSQSSFWDTPRLAVCIRCSLTVFILWSFWIFFPTLGGKSHGNRENMVKSSILLKNDSFSNSNPMPLDQRQPCTVEPDFHMLYQPDYEAQRQIGGTFDFALYDPGRMMAIPLWGSLVTAPLNPVNIFLRELPFDWSIAVKSLFYFLIASVGAGLLALDFSKTSINGAWMAGTFYFASSYMFFFIHWQNGLGIASLAPGATWILLQWFQTQKVKWLLPWFGVVAWMILMNMVQVFAHFCLFTAVFTISWLIFGRSIGHSKRMFCALIAALVSVCSIIFCGGYLYDVLLNAFDSSRPKYEFTLALYPYIQLPNIKQIFSDFLLAVPSPMTSESWWRPTILLPFLVVVIFGVRELASKSQEPLVRMAIFLLSFYLIFFYFGWLDRFLYILGPFYAPNSIAIRGMFTLFLVLSITIGFGFSNLERAMISKRIRIIGMALVVIFSLIYMSAAFGLGEVGLWTVAQGGELFLNSQRWMPEFHLMVVSSLIASAILFIPKTSKGSNIFYAFMILSVLGLGLIRIPQNTASVAPLANNTNPSPNLTRSTRLIPPIPHIAMGGPVMDLRFLHDAVLSHFDIRGFSGYHTTFSQQERNIYDLFVSEDYKTHRVAPGGWWKDTGWGFYQTIVEQNAISSNGEITNLQLARLNLLGVSRVYLFPHATIDFDWQDPEKWKFIETESCSIAHFFESKKPDEIVEIFKPASETKELLAMQKASQAVNIDFNPKSQIFEMTLPGKSGTLLLSANLRRNFKCYINSKKTNLKPDENFPFWLIDLPTGTETVSLVPDHGAIWMRILIGFGVGGISFLIVFLFAKKGFNSHVAKCAFLGNTSK